ncbi:hypothetical protein PMZ80_002307 [Knufia obscura]|uniref:Uncharacterized protein n=1 Tax=Knufia obscura TaxID=1635080 RepID=A0ABR0RWZ1_9EURO|nr:hypothetical protein PMZ80_002307 [Knufia obscura]
METTSPIPHLQLQAPRPSSSSSIGTQDVLILILIVATIGYIVNRVGTALDEIFGTAGKNGGPKKVVTPATPGQTGMFKRGLPDLNDAIKNLGEAVKAHGGSAEVTIKME